MGARRTRCSGRASASRQAEACLGEDTASEEHAYGRRNISGDAKGSLSVPRGELYRRRVAGGRYGAEHSVTNPATGAAIGRVPSLGAKETARAIEAAQARLAGLARDARRKERAAILRRLVRADAGESRRPRRIMTAEQGKPLAESRGEIAYAASFIEWFAEEAKRVYGDTIPQHVTAAASSCSRSRSASSPRSRPGTFRPR